MAVMNAKDSFGDGRDGKNAMDGKRGSNAPSSHNSHASHSSPGFLIHRGDYRTLLSYQKSEVVYEITFRFCQRFLSKSDRTTDQMIQAARSGKQNIIEGSKAAVTSMETEIKLTNVARASLEELLEDYLDYLRVRDLGIWTANDPKAQFVRTLGMVTPLTFEVFREFTETRSDEVVANMAICLINQANFLLDRQIKALEQGFLQKGGLRERMTRARIQARDNQNTHRDPQS